MAGDDAARKHIGTWNKWHEAYEDTESELVQRMLAVRRQVDAVVTEAAPGPVTVVSICGGQGRELIGALEDHPRRADVRGRLVELDSDNAAFAREWAASAGLDALEVVNGDASVSDAYAGLTPVDLVVISGVFGHVDDDDKRQLVVFLRQLCAPGASLVWTSHRTNDGPADKVRAMLADESFEEVAFEDLPGEEFAFTVARHRYLGETAPFVARERIFTFGSRRGEPKLPA